MNAPLFVAGLVAVLAGAYLYRDDLAEVATQAAVSVRDFLAGIEGFSATPYPDGKGQSIGYGHQITGQEQTSDPEELLTADIGTAEDALARFVKVALTDNQRVALTSFVYNVGAGNFARSTLLRKLNAGDYAGAAREFDRWVYSNGTRLAGLVARRAREREMFLS